MKAVITGYIRLTEEQAARAREEADDMSSEIGELLAEGLNSRDCDYRYNMGNIEVAFEEE